MIDLDPEKRATLEILEEKHPMSLTADELKIEQDLLRDKLKHVGRNLDRFVQKQMVAI